MLFIKTGLTGLGTEQTGRNSSRLFPTPVSAGSGSKGLSQFCTEYP